MPSGPQPTNGPQAPESPLEAPQVPVVEKKDRIVHILAADKLFTDKQLQYARRVRDKLSSTRTLLQVLQDLRYVTQEQVRDALVGSKVPIPLGALLVEFGVISESDLESALGLQKERPGRRLGQILIEHSFLDEKGLLELFCVQLGYPRLSPTSEPLDSGLIDRAPVKWFRDNEILPVGRRDAAVVVALAYPLDVRVVEAAHRLFGPKLIIGIAKRVEILEALDFYEASRHKKPSAELKDNFTVQTANEIIQAAADANVSDIHVEPMRDRLRIRFRRDGVLVNYKDFPQDMIGPLTSRIKVMASVDIAERRRHQDGRILFESKGIPFDIRLSTYVTVHGETIVMRLLRGRSQLLEIREIGMAPRMLQCYIDDVLDTPSGVVIITGPTGSGKTTTLYGSISYLNDPNTSIITAEDPVEYVIDGISQCSINSKINLTFEHTLRSIVRQDPDIIVIGEVRDKFSAETAIQAALTGHKVLTTFHTEDSIGGLLRLLNMDIEAFLISSTVVSVIAQRLVRRVCRQCAEDQVLTPQQLGRLGLEPQHVKGYHFKSGRGCRACNYTGYSGRLAIFELLVLNEAVKDALIAHRTSYEIRRIGLESTGMVTLFEDGIYKALRGDTSYQEVIRELPRLSKARPPAELFRILGEGR